MKIKYDDKSIKSILYYLKTHNKNLTKQQEWALDDLQDKIYQLCEALDGVIQHAYNGNTIGYTKIAIKILKGENYV